LLGMKMHFSFFFLGILLALFTIKAVEWVNLTPLFETPTIHSQFTSTKNPNVSIRFVTNSSVCETTPGVHQISGYLDVGKNMSMVRISFKFLWSVTNWASVVLVLCGTTFSGNGSFHTLVRPMFSYAGTQVIMSC
jgi:hypothetical protein